MAVDVAKPYRTQQVKDISIGFDSTGNVVDNAIKQNVRLTKDNYSEVVFDDSVLVSRGFGNEEISPGKKGPKDIGSISKKIVGLVKTGSIRAKLAQEEKVIRNKEELLRRLASRPDYYGIVVMQEGDENNVPVIREMSDNELAHLLYRTSNKFLKRQNRKDATEEDLRKQDKFSIKITAHKLKRFKTLLSRRRSEYTRAGTKEVKVSAAEHRRGVINTCHLYLMDHNAEYAASYSKYREAMKSSGKSTGRTGHRDERDVEIIYEYMMYNGGAHLLPQKFQDLLAASIIISNGRRYRTQYLYNTRSYLVLGGSMKSETLTSFGTWENVFKPQTISIPGIGHTLSRIIRFGGHSDMEMKGSVSVGSHSIGGAELMLYHGFFNQGGSQPHSQKRSLFKHQERKRLALLFLLHDAHECFIGDITTPIAQAFQHLLDRHKIDFKKELDGVKDGLDESIFVALDIEKPSPSEKAVIKELDRKMCEIETKVIFPKAVSRGKFLMNTSWGSLAAAKEAERANQENEDRSLNTFLKREPLPEGVADSLSVKVSQDPDQERYEKLYEKYNSGDEGDQDKEGEESAFISEHKKKKPGILDGYPEITDFFQEEEVQLKDKINKSLSITTPTAYEFKSFTSAAARTKYLSLISGFGMSLTCDGAIAFDGMSGQMRIAAYYTWLTETLLSSIANRRKRFISSEACELFVNSLNREYEAM